MNHRTSSLAAAALAVAALLAPGAAARNSASATTTAATTGAATSAVQRTEVVVDRADGLVVSHVRLHVPMLPAAKPHPARCDWIGYLRYRWAGGPADPVRSDGVIVAQPEALLGGYSLNRMARNLLAVLNGRGLRMEFWSIEPRSECMYDRTGIRAARAAGDYHLAWDYYFGGKPADGRSFAGFPANSQLHHLADMGVRQTVWDQYSIMVHDLPDPGFRRNHAFCAGASDGGLWQAAFAAWDFAGVPGYLQCRALLTPESIPTTDPLAAKDSDLGSTLTDLVGGRSYDQVAATFEDGAAPQSFSIVPMASPEWWTLLSIAGLAAEFAPNEETDLNRLAMKVPKLRTALRFMFTDTLADFVLGSNGIDTFHFTNQALLGTLVDNNAANFSLLSWSVGALSGGPVAPKTFPWPDLVRNIPVVGRYLALVTGSTDVTRVGPTDHHVLYTWRSHDDVADIPFTAPYAELVDIDEFARQVGSPLGFANPYMSMRWFLADQPFIWLGARSGDLTALRHTAEGARLPSRTIWSRASLESALAPVLPADTTYIDGPTHVDIGSAAAVQYDGGPDSYARLLAEFIAHQS